MAELIAIANAFVSIAMNANVVIYTDSEAAIKAINSFEPEELSKEYVSTVKIYNI
jgi:ribonuclease HI